MLGRYAVLRAGDDVGRNRDDSLAAGAGAAADYLLECEQPPSILSSRLSYRCRDACALLQDGAGVFVHGKTAAGKPIDYPRVPKSITWISFDFVRAV